MKKIISVVGARPNFMKVAPIDRELKKYRNKIKHLIIHTGQHYDKNMSDAFFDDLDMPHPDYFLNIRSGSHAEQTAKTMIEFEKVILKEKPDLVLVVGDVNSTVACSLTAIKLHIPVAHIESGLRSFDREMPEEVNRIVTDSISNFHFITETSGIENLIKEGHKEDSIFFVGNTMIDSQYYAKTKISDNRILEKLNVNKSEYILATIHRPSNVDNKEQLRDMLEVLKYVGDRKKIVFPMHPRTKNNISKFELDEIANSISNLIITEPLGYLDFLTLMMNSDFVLTDSGGIQEESTALGVECLTLRNNTERPSTIEEGTNTLVKPQKDNMLKHLDNIFSGNRKSGKVPKLWDGKASERICDILVNKILAE